MNGRIPCKAVIVHMCDNEAHREDVTLLFKNVEAIDDGRRLMIKDKDTVTAFNMDYVLSYEAQVTEEREE